METTLLKAQVVAANAGKPLNVLGHIVSVKLAMEDTDGHYYVFEVITPPGNGIPPHVHDREDELIHVLEGEFGIMLGGENFVAKAGDLLFFPRHIPHAFQNIGTTAGKTHWTVIPGGNFEAFFEELAALPSGPPDLKVVAKIFADYGMEVLI